MIIPKSELEINESYSYFNTLLKNERIKNNEIYDLNDTKFIKSLEENKKKYNIILTRATEDKLSLIYSNNNNNKYDILRKLLIDDIIVNEKYGLTTEGNGKYLLGYFSDKFNCSTDNIRTDVINGVIFEREYLRQTLPYLIRHDKEKCSFENRKYENISESYDYLDHYNYTYLYNDGTCPWYRNEYLKLYINKFKEITNGKKYIITDERTTEILSMIL